MIRFGSDRVPLAAFGGRRLLALTGDDALVEQMRRGNEAAFEVTFDRYAAQILGFCRHMLGSTEEAEDAVQHTFAAAFRDLGLNHERTVVLKPWLYTIARNRCISVLRARHEQPAVLHEPSTIALADEVERRAEVQELLKDMLDLPDDQRAALLLSQGGALSHAEVAGVLGCETAKVKGLVFRARMTLIQRREARETPCAAIREQLANLRGGALRRAELRNHLRGCPGCRAFREQVRQQRRLLGAALPAVPSLALKSSVLGGSAGGGLATAFGGGTLAKVAVTGMVACGGAAVVVDAQRPPVPPARDAAAAKAPSRPATAAPATAAPVSVARPAARRGAGERAVARRATGRRGAAERAVARRAAGRRGAAERRRPAADRRAAADRRRASGRGRAADRRAARGREAEGRSRALGRAKAAPLAGIRVKPAPQGRGPVAAPPASAPARRGPPVRKKPAKASAPPAPAPPGPASPSKAKKP